ncbi:hypothetical protein EVAR_75618_1 [Eumeta japonica]|uniref:Uncharacterized protein n=1 Tax=Eumeta variegata TaxID=151549 RepID=A0A4C1U1D8_EUMVA|nr:hypothetical protein EVAR_75618_1 [Eumeta japonica]
MLVLKASIVKQSKNFLIFWKPIPMAKARTSNRGRKTTRANMITLSPYKLTESLRLAENRERGRRRGHGVRHNHNGEGAGRNAVRCQRDTTSSSSSESDEDAMNTDYDDSCTNMVPENADVPYMFCITIYSNDRSGEPWVVSKLRLMGSCSL